MPNIKSAKKRLKQDAVRRVENKTKKSMMRTWIRKLNEAVQAGDKTEAQKMLPTVFKKIDKAAKAGCIHANTASRRKALASRRVHAMS
ncbi:MAG: 30S ribosomal protein S20 [Planctomycetes bacterium]|nr:30S ribosomal protein S20 [Planctomycetota bacterium]MCA8980058.1 30S ribosomal protein S20 [Planctomycetota bacterium]MCB9917774.1 30S ribosomal protein S20 [Planctomycetota bacterium]